MKKPAIFLVFVAFFFCYLEWADQSAFVFEIAYQILFQRGDKAGSFSHPMVLLPFMGQLLVLIAFFQQHPKKWMVISGILLMSILVLFLVFIGIFGKNWRIGLSTLPFLIAAIWTWRIFSQKAAKTPNPAPPTTDDLANQKPNFPNSN